MKKSLSMFLIIIMITILSVPGLALAASVKISKAKATMELDSTLKLTVTGMDSKITWSSNKKTVAIVSTSGTVTAKAEGTATITATINSKKYTCFITVVDSNKISPTPAVNEPYDKIFAMGEYVVGIDIPADKYNLKGIDGWGFVYVYDSEISYENDDSYKLIMMCGGENVETLSSMYSETYSNLKLKDGQYIVIEQTLKVQFTN